MSDLEQNCGEESFNKTEKLEKKLYKCQQNLKETTESIVILENNISEKKLYKCQQNLKETTKNIVILENTLENNISEIESLQLKLKNMEEATSIYSCEKCEKGKDI